MPLDLPGGRCYKECMEDLVMKKLVQLVAVGAVTFIGQAHGATLSRIKCEVPYATRTTHVSFTVQANTEGFPFGAGSGVANIRVNYLGKITNRRLAVSSYYHKAHSINVFQRTPIGQPDGFYFRSNTGRDSADSHQLFDGTFAFGQHAGKVNCRFVN